MLAVARRPHPHEEAERDVERRDDDGCRRAADQAEIAGLGEEIAVEQALDHQRNDQEEQDELPFVELGIGPAPVLVVEEGVFALGPQRIVDALLQLSAMLVERGPHRRFDAAHAPLEALLREQFAPAGDLGVERVKARCRFLPDRGEMLAGPRDQCLLGLGEHRRMGRRLVLERVAGAVMPGLHRFGEVVRRDGGCGAASLRLGAAVLIRHGRTASGSGGRRRHRPRNRGSRDRPAADRHARTRPSA